MRLSIDDELRDVDLGDKRLHNRARKVLGDLFSDPPKPVSTPPATIDRAPKGPIGCARTAMSMRIKSWRRTQQRPKNDSSLTTIFWSFKTPPNSTLRGTLPGIPAFSTSIIDSGSTIARISH